MTRDDPGDDVPISVDNIFGNCQRNVIFAKSFQLILWQHNNLEIVTTCTNHTIERGIQSNCCVLYSGECLGTRVVYLDQFKNLLLLVNIEFN